MMRRLFRGNDEERKDKEQTIASGKAQIDESLKAQVAALYAPSGAQCSRNSLSSNSPGVLSPRNSWSSNALACRITGRAPNPTDAPQPTIASPTLYFEKSFNLFEGWAPNTKPMAPELDLQQPELSTTLYDVTPASPRLLADFEKAQLDELDKKCQQQDDMIKQLREELVFKQKLLADNYSAIFSVDDQVDIQLNEKLSAMQASLETSKAETASALASLEEMKENLNEVDKAHEKELADMNASNALLKAQLEKALAMGASLEASKAETASAKAAIQAKDAQVDELKRRLAEMEKESEKSPDEDKAIANKDRLSEVCKAHENELEVITAAKEKELADQKAENAALKSQFEKALQAQQTENDNLKRSTTELLKECKGFEADILAKGAEIERFKTQMAEQEKSQIIASGNEEIESLKDQVSALQKKLREMHEEDSKNTETMTVDKDQNKQLKARVVVLDKEVEGAELENLSEVIKAREKELADMNAANAVLKAQLEKALAEVKDLQQQAVDKQAEIAVLKEEVSRFEKKIRELRKNEDEIREQLEASKAETASAKAVLQPKDAQVDELKRRLAGMEEELEKTRDVEKETKNELEALHKNAAAIIKQLQEAEAALKRCVQSCQSQHDENDNLKRSMAEVFNEFEPFRKIVAAIHKTLQEAEVALNQSVESFQAPMQRAIRLTKVLHDEVFRSSFTVRECISTASGGTTVGISFNDKNASVTACMVGGPAFNSKQVHQNDVIIAIDGQEVKGPEILDLLIGNDKPGSVVELTLKRESGKLEQVKLQRMAKSLIADKTKMFDLFTRILDRSQKGKDSELIKYVQEATDFWTLMMLEEHRYDQICMHNIHCMKDACQNWLDELVLILNSLHGIAHAGAKEEIKAQKAQVLALKKPWKASLEIEENFSEVGKARRPPDRTAANAVVVSTQPEKALADGNDSSPCHWRPMSSAQLDAVVFDDDYLFKILVEEENGEVLRFSLELAAQRPLPPVPDNL